MPLARIGSVIETFHARYLALMSDPRIQTIIIFRNRGVAAGATLTHPHSQIIAMPLIPPEIERRQKLMERYAEAHGRCLYCDIVDSERREGTRVIRETGEFIAFVPYAAETPFFKSGLCRNGTRPVLTLSNRKKYRDSPSYFTTC